jgi:hypothetical protein
MGIPLVVSVVWAAVVVTLIIQGRNKYAKQRVSKTDRT